MTLVSAPAGYGKTTLVSHWLAGCDRANAWASLGEEDNALGDFLVYFLAAMRTMFPESMRRSLTLLRGDPPPSPKALGVALPNDLDDVDERFVLVLDGVEFLKDRSILDLLTTLLRHPPRSMTLVLVGRRDPFLPIASLRTAIRINEIRTRDLRFRVDETLALLEKGPKALARPEMAAAWTEATEGWITGLQLALGDTGGVPPPDEKSTALTRHVRQYLQYEILDRQPSRVRRFLLDASILDRLCAPLCDDLCAGGVWEGLEPGKEGSTLDWLRHQGVFLIPLDPEDRWFRFHGLVRDFLRARLEVETGPEDRMGLHSRASRWYAENGFVEDAVKHAVAAGDSATAEALVETNLHALMDAEEWDRIGTALGYLSPARVECRPELVLARAWMSFDGLRYDEADASLDGLEDLLESVSDPRLDTPSLRGGMQALRSSLSRVRGDALATVAEASQALERLHEDAPYQRGTALANLIWAHWRLGDRGSAKSLFGPLLADSTRRTVRIRTRILAGLCALHWEDGDLVGVDQAAARCLDLEASGGSREAAARAHLYRGLAHYQRNNLSAAERDLVAAQKQRHLPRGLPAMEAAHALALVYLAQGRHDEASVTGADPSEGGARAPAPGLAETHRCLRADLALRRGDVEEALELLESSDVGDDAPPMQATHRCLALVKACLAHGDPSHRLEAAEILGHLDAPSGPSQSVRLRMETLALQAVLFMEEGRRKEAKEYLRKSLALAAPGRFLRLYVDLGPPMANLLKPLARNEPDGGFVREILTAHFDASATLGGWSPGSASTPASTHDNAAELLTKKELETLGHLSEGLYNREIAERSFVTVETVKTHLKHIYRKLDVANRREAIMKAKALGLLPET